MFNVTTYLSNCTSNAPATIAPNEPLSFTITAPDGYPLSSAVIYVSIGGVQTREYSFNEHTGEFYIDSDYIFGDIVIRVNLYFSGYSVTWNLTGCTGTGGDIADGSNNVYAKITPNKGYALPNDITVTIGGRTAVVNEDYSWEPYGSMDIDIFAASINGDIVVTIAATAISSFPVETLLTNCTGNFPDRAAAGSDYTGFLTANEGLSLNNCIIAIRVNGDLLPSVAWNFEPSTGELNIWASYIYGKITIQATVYSAGAYTITTHLRYCTSDIPNAVGDADSCSGTIKAKTGFLLPYDIAVYDSTGHELDPGMEYNYTLSADRKTATFLKDEVNDDLIIEVIATPAIYNVTVNIYNGSYNSPTTADPSEDLNLFLYPASGFQLPESIDIQAGGRALTAGPDYQYERKTGEVNVWGFSITGDIVITCRCIVRESVYITKVFYHVSAELPDRVPINSNIETVFKPWPGFSLPKNITVYVDNKSITDFEYSASTGNFKLAGKYVIADIKIVVKGVMKKYRVTMILNHCTGEAPATVEYNTAISAKFKAVGKNYFLPNTIDVTVNRRVIYNYRWQQSGGILYIPTEEINGDIEIIVTAVKRFSIFTNMTGCRYIGPTFINSGESLSVKIEADKGFTLPTSIEVKNVENSNIIDWSYINDFTDQWYSQYQTHITYDEINDIITINKTASRAKYTLSNVLNIKTACKGYRQIVSRFSSQGPAVFLDIYNSNSKGGLNVRDRNNLSAPTSNGHYYDLSYLTRFDFVVPTAAINNLQCRYHLYENQPKSGYTWNATTGELIIPAELINSDFYIIVNAIAPDTCVFFQNTAEPNRVNKTDYLTEQIRVAGNLRDIADISNPSITFECADDKILKSNYVYIPAFNRYYFINSITSVRTNLWRVNLHCDVLYSFRNDVLQIKAIIDRQENNFNRYLIDNNMPLSSIPYKEAKEILTDDNGNGTLFKTQLQEYGYNIVLTAISPK